MQLMVNLLLMCVWSSSLFVSSLNSPFLCEWCLVLNPFKCFVIRISFWNFFCDRVNLTRDGVCCCESFCQPTSACRRTNRWNDIYLNIHINFIIIGIYHFHHQYHYYIHDSNVYISILGIHHPIIHYYHFIIIII